MDEAPPKKCFKVLTNDEFKAKMDDLENQNSVNSEKHADKAFRQFLSESGANSVEYHLFKEQELDDWLSKFWFGARTANNKLYTVNSLKSFRYGLKCHLQKVGHTYHITKDTAFSNSQKAFASTCKELKEEGKGVVKNYEEKDDEGNSILFIHLKDISFLNFRFFAKYFHKIYKFSRCFHVITIQ